MNDFDFLISAVEYTKRKIKEFLQKNNCEQYLKNIYDKAEEKMKESGIIEYVNTLTNGTVDVVVRETGKNHNDVCDEFQEHYFKNK